MDAAYSLRLLTDDPALVDLCLKYWEIDSNGTFPHKVNDLVRASGVKRKDLDRTLSSSCEAVSATVLCSTCQRPYVYLNRTDYQGLTRWPRAWWRPGWWTCAAAAPAGCSLPNWACGSAVHRSRTTRW